MNVPTKRARSAGTGLSEQQHGQPCPAAEPEWVARVLDMAAKVESARRKKQG